MEVAGGPISNFSAVGKTGNQLPDNNELSGRSGEGRSGRSQGQLVQDVARGLQGRQTPTRITNDAYEQGVVKELQQMAKKEAALAAAAMAIESGETPAGAPIPAEILAAAGVAAPAGAPALSRFRARAFLKVQDGCDMSCAFCVIPSVRGRSVSVPLAPAVGQARRLAGQGYAEIVLTGIHLCSYGRDLAPRASFLDILRALDTAVHGGGSPESFSVRLSSLDPRLMPAPAPPTSAASDCTR